MITKKEYEFLKKIKTEGSKWIARDKNGKLYRYQETPKRCRTIWNFGGVVVNIRGEYFTFIKWEDEKPTKILDLIQDYEKHEELKCKVVLHQFVADWIEECKKSKLFFSNLNLLEGNEKVKDWIYEHDNGNDVTMKREEMVIKAYYDGYVVEKEKLYTVTLSNGYVLGKGDTLILFLNNEHTSWLTYETKLTQSEIESVDPVLMKIAKEVE